MIRLRPLPKLSGAKDEPDVTRMRRSPVARVLGTTLLACMVWSCDSQPDVAYIQDFRAFTIACSHCRQCQPGEESNLCVKDGERCVELCPDDERAFARGLQGGNYMCRCGDGDDIWVFDAEARKVALRKAPIDDSGREVR
jgi:hypothetical protein